MSQDSPPQRGSHGVAATEGIAAASIGSAAESHASSTHTGLKLVTVSPSQSFPDGSLTVAGAESERSSKRPDPYLGCTIDNRYKVEAVLGEGGMGIVYLCRHKIIDKKVAMKVLRADMARDTEVTGRFLIEARAASSIGHEHIIDISDFGQLPDGSAYFVMEYLDGTPLSWILQGQRPVPVLRILHIARQLAEGLLAAHRAGIVHRDLKPDNVYLIKRGSDADFVKILDFGIAKVSSSAAGKLTRAGSVFGTPHYMSPEQAAGTAVDHRGDIYSVGVIFYELACGRVPFDADNFMGILTQHIYKAPVPICALVPPPQDVPPGLEAIILKCLSKRPEQRYQDMEELIVDLDTLMDGKVPHAVSDMMSRSGGFNVPADFFKQQPAASSVRRRGRWPVYAAVAGAVALAGMLAGFLGRGADTPAEDQVAAEAPVPSIAAEPLVPSPSSAEGVVTVSTQVAIAIEPIDAEVFRGTESLGSSPVVVQIVEGEVVELEIRRKGYESQMIRLDGNESKQRIVLKKAARPATVHPAVRRPQTAPKPTAAPKPPKPAIGSGAGEIVNPWGR